MTASGTGGSWTPSIPPTTPHQAERDALRGAIYDWLARKAPSLADLYVSAFHLTYSLPLPGRARLVAHAVREICNALPTYVAGPKGQRVDYANLVIAVHAEWKRASLPLRVEDLPGAIELPTHVTKPIVDLLERHGSQENAREAAGRLFAAADPSGNTDPATLRPLATRWRTDTDWANKIAHDPREPHSLPSDGELRQRFELFEDHLYGLSGPYFDVLEEMDAILAEANS